MRLVYDELRTLASRHDWIRFQVAAAAVELADALFSVNPKDPTACREVEPGIAARRELVARDRVPGGTDRARFAALIARCRAN